MFQINDYIFHGGSGVCVVEDICSPPHTRCTDSSRQYYRLNPLYESGSVIYTPIDSSGTMVRRLLTRQEVQDLIGRIPDIKPLIIDNDKQRDDAYRTALRTNDCTEWIRVIKTIYLRNQARKLDGKRMNQVDEKYFQMAEGLLYGELAVPLEIPREQVRDYMVGKIQAAIDSTEEVS